MHTMKAYIMCGGVRLGLVLAKLAASLFMAWIVSLPLIPLAAADRGYEGAYGGEWLLIIGAFVFTYYILAKTIRPP